MKIDPKDLLKVETFSDFRLGGKFYILQPDGSYHPGVFYKSDVERWPDSGYIKLWLMEKISNGLMFVQREKKWYAMNGMPPEWERKTIVWTV